MDAYGIKSTLLLWIKDFLNGRLQQVVLNGSAFRTFTVSSGVPQGSVLGLLLFLLYVNEIPEQIECNISMFADDTKVYTAVKDIADSQRLQADLNSLAQWAKDWLFRFNVKKCKHMPIGPQSAITSYAITDADNVIHSLSTTDCEKDQVFSAKNLMLRQCKASPLLNEHLNTLQKNHSTSSIKHTSDHILNTVSRPGAHNMPRTSIY